jgi:hypothetical protein
LFESSDFRGVGCPFGSPGHELFFGFKKRLAPALVHVLIHTFPAPPPGDTGFTSQAIQNDSDVLFCKIRTPGLASNVFDGFPLNRIDSFPDSCCVSLT